MHVPEHARRSGVALEAQLWLLRMRTDATSVRARDHAGWMRDLRREERKARKKPGADAALASARLLFGSSLGERPIGRDDLRTYARARTRDARKLLDHALSPERAMLVVIGRFDEQNLRLSGDKWFADWQARTAAPVAPRDAPPLPNPPERTVQVVDDRSATRYTVELACQLGPGSTHPMNDVIETLVGEVLDAPDAPGVGVRRWPAELAAITSSGVAETARRCVGHEVLTVSGHAERVRAELAAVGIEVGAGG